jgi:hypothetical protein
MSGAIDVLRVATSAGARFTVSGDRLTVTAPRPLPTELVDQLRRAKGEVIALLTADPVSSLYEERAAIVEYGAGVPRSWAEGFACLDPARPPADVPLRRWQQFVDDLGQFLDAGWGEKVAGLGWGPLDLFGCDRERPFARIDHAGLLWLLNGDRLVELDRRGAVIETRTGARQTFRRRPLAVGDVVLAWELAE